MVMGITISKNDQKLIETAIDTLLNENQIEITAGRCGYSMTANFFPQDFVDFCNKATKLVLKAIEKQILHCNELTEFTNGIIQNKLKEKCCIIDPLTERNPPPNIKIWNWMISW